MKTYRVLMACLINGALYREGELITLHHRQAGPLLASGQVKLSVTNAYHDEPKEQDDELNEETTEEPKRRSSSRVTKL